jgi:hypothetical protein
MREWHSASIEILQSEAEEFDRLAEDEFTKNYRQEYDNACAQAEEKCIPITLAVSSARIHSAAMKTPSK